MCRRVHITEESLKFLNNDYEVEDGNAGERSAYLRDNNIKTYLIVEKQEHSYVSNAGIGGGEQSNISNSLIIGVGKGNRRT